MKNKFIILLLIFVLASCVCACTGSETTDSASTIVLDAGSGGAIYMDEAKYYAYTRQASYEAYYIAYNREIDWQKDASDGITYEKAVKDSVLNDLCRQLVITSHAKEMDVSLNDEDKSACADMASQYFLDSSESMLLALDIAEARLCEVFESQKLYEKMCDTYIADNNMEVSIEKCATAVISFVVIENKEQGEAIAKKIAHKVKSGELIEEAAAEYAYDVIEANISERNDDGSAFAKAALSLTTGDIEWVDDGEKFYVIYCDLDYDKTATQKAYEDELNETREKAADLMYEMWEDETKIKINNEKWDEIRFDAHIFNLED